MSKQQKQRIAYHPLSIHDELLTPQAVPFKDINIGEYFVYRYATEGKKSGCSRYVLYQKILTDTVVRNGSPVGEIRALDVQQGTDMFMHATDMVIPVEVIMQLHLGCFCEHTSLT